MKEIWAPWRGQYILGIKDERKAASADLDPCILCSKHKDKPENDRDNLVLFRGERCFVMMNLYPYNAGHLMIVPYMHTGEFDKLPFETVCELMALTQKLLAVFRRAMAPHGFNYGMNLGRVAGAGIIDHVHAHIVPRWNGDTNFMPVLADTKVISEHIETTYDRLRDAMSAEGML